MCPERDRVDMRAIRSLVMPVCPGSSNLPKGNHQMRKFVFGLVAAVLALPAIAAEQSTGAPAATDQKTVEQAMVDFRTDLQAKRADLMAKGMTLTAEQAAKFWPMYEQFQREQNSIIDEQGKAVAEFSKKYEALTDADSLAFINAQLQRDRKMLDLRVKYLAKFQTVLPSGLAARAIQIDRRISNAGQVLLSSQIPLVR